MIPIASYRLISMSGLNVKDPSNQVTRDLMCSDGIVIPVIYTEEFLPGRFILWGGRFIPQQESDLSFGPLRV